MCTFKNNKIKYWLNRHALAGLGLFIENIGNGCFVVDLEERSRKLMELNQTNNKVFLEPNKLIYSAL